VLLLGLDHLGPLLEGPGAAIKMVFNGSGAIFFPAKREHREMTAPGIRYADNYKGNAMAAMVSAGKVEIRYHKAFKDDEVAEILRRLLEKPELGGTRGWEFTYQGRTVAL
jgi:hypothetical protein